MIRCQWPRSGAQPLPLTLEQTHGIKQRKSNLFKSMASGFLACPMGGILITQCLFSRFRVFRSVHFHGYILKYTAGLVKPGPLLYAKFAPEELSYGIITKPGAARTCPSSGRQGKAFECLSGQKGVSVSFRQGLPGRLAASVLSLDSTSAH